MPVKIVGLGASIPYKKVSNEDISKELDTTDSWITTRTGIKTRYHSGPDEYTSQLAYNAGLAAINSMSARYDIDTLILATTTPDRKCPATAPKVASMLGLKGITAFDMNAVCTGFVYALEMAESFIRSGKSERVLVIGADVYSTLLDKEDRATFPLFGDGAGAMIIENGDEENILSSYTGSDGRYEQLITVEGGGSESALREKESKNAFFTMQGKDVFLKAISHMKNAVIKASDLANLPVTDLDFIVPHQANKRIIDTLSSLFDLREEQALTSLEEFGNTSSASIPITLTKHVLEGTIKPGNKVAITAFGGGITWGAAILKWPEINIEPEFI
ncbi:beta-ketoacyl-ACP synthase III [Vibrio ouci]|uniref:Beta-ketoacyl-[acyl-carrier-protein] synthase III n=1 Tax=Vibrio ouci TaxID=2499078 RepID=A0A4Y8WCB5_9VIBR|nr:beta-ketoacyl-ACP synthase III [Vibrio ouci]TFH90263.1 ketoacyl-ACP synthase III [Vibrio ouci]